MNNNSCAKIEKRMIIRPTNINHLFSVCFFFRALGTFFFQKTLPLLSILKIKVYRNSLMQEEITVNI